MFTYGIDYTHLFLHMMYVSTWHSILISENSVSSLGVHIVHILKDNVEGYPECV